MLIPQHFKKSPVPESNSARIILELVTMMAIRDGAERIRWEPRFHQLDVWYSVNGTYHELVPPPLHLFPSILRELRRIATWVMPERTSGFLRRLVGPSRVDKAVLPSIGWLTIEMGGQLIDATVRTKPGKWGERVLIEFDPTLVLSESALAWQADYWHGLFELRKDGMIEFEDKKTKE
jgi:hypothetical protein